MHQPFFPGIPWDPRAHDEFVQDLFVAWNQVASANEDNDRSCLVLVWFVDHQQPNPHGHAPRQVRLWSNLQDWRTQLWMAWQDQIIPGCELEYNHVTPMPFTTDRSVAAHVVIIQRPTDTWVTSIATLFDERAIQSIVYQMAVTTHEHIRLEHLVRAFGIEEICFGRTPIFSCLAWYRDLSLRPNAPIPGCSGMSIEMLLRHMPVQTRHVPSDTEINSLLTLSVQTKPSCALSSAPIALRLSDQQSPAELYQSNNTNPHLTPVTVPAANEGPALTPPFVSDLLADLQTEFPCGQRCSRVCS